MLQLLKPLNKLGIDVRSCKHDMIRIPCVHIYKHRPELSLLTVSSTKNLSCIVANGSKAYNNEIVKVGYEI
jgi:hypothetical protein